MEKRYIVNVYRNCNHLLNMYESRKEGENVGRKYSIKGLFSLINSRCFNFVLDNNSLGDVEEERERRRERKSCFKS